jgi:hypothetical protein
MRSIQLCILVFVLLSGANAFSQIVNGTISAGAGDSGRAAVDPSESTLLNPASVAHLDRYYSSAHYGILTHPTEGDGDRLIFVLADGTPGNLASGAFSYVKTHQKIGSFSWMAQDLQVSFGFFPINKFAIGASVHRYMSSAREVTGNQDNGTLGFLFTPTNELGFALVGYDLLNSSESIPMETRLKRTYAVAAHYLWQEKFRLRLDLVHPEVGNPKRRTDVMAGLESFFTDDFAFRLGAHWKETTDQMFLTTGVGFKGPRLSFDYSFQKDARASEGSRHMFDLWLPL